MQADIILEAIEQLKYKDIFDYLEIVITA